MEEALAKPTDLLAPFRDLEKQAKRSKGVAQVNVKIKGGLFLDTDGSVPSFSVATLLADAIKGDIEANQFPVLERTRRRRTRSLRTPQQGRYLQGYQPNPNGPYGTDSGYLRDNIKAALAKGNTAFVGIPRNRQKAAFVLRRISKEAERPSPKAINRGLLRALKAMVGKDKRKMQAEKRKLLRGG